MYIAKHKMLGVWLHWLKADKPICACARANAKCENYNYRIQQSKFYVVLNTHTPSDSNWIVQISPYNKSVIFAWFVFYITNIWTSLKSPISSKMFNCTVYKNKSLFFVVQHFSLLHLLLFFASWIRKAIALNMCLVFNRKKNMFVLIFNRHTFSSHFVFYWLPCVYIQ